MQSVLVPLSGLKSALIYDLQGLDGAMKHAFSAVQVAERLYVAADYLRQQSSDEQQIELMIWDAFRTRQTQQAIYDRYVGELMKSVGCSYEEGYIMASAFVSLPTSVYPHGTGGAVDVTLLINGQEVFMGTGFDDFIAESASDWYRENPPQTTSDQSAAQNRELLRHVMEASGFVGLPNEWWHFEWGTARWAEITQQPIILDSILSPPKIQGPASVHPYPPRRQPIWQMGTAQVFTSPDVRSAALFHTEPGHYYARTSHPTVEALEDYIKEMLLPCRHVALTSSGLSACITAFKSFVPRGGCIVYDAFIYYEVEREILALAADFEWQVIKEDFTDIKKLSRTVENSDKVHVFFCDHPRNWWLDALEIQAISHIAKQYDSLLVVDTSVQPLQELISQGVDAVVFSLSKYPSLSLTLGGAILCDTSHLYNALNVTLTREGNIISPDAAATIWTQIVSLRDRMSAISHKATQVAAFLNSHPCVYHVRFPDAKRCGGFTGGQVTFHVQNYVAGMVAERVVGYNSLAKRSSLHLACTFGASMTTFEHFASNVRLRTGVPRELTNEICLPDDIIRIGIGCESVTEIISDLSFVLNIAQKHINQ